MQSINRRICLALFTLCSMALLTSCIKVDQALTLAPDGSGVFHVRYGMREDDIAQMQAMAEEAARIEGVTNAATGASPFDFSESEIRKDFTAYEAKGVKLNDVKISTDQGWKFVDLQIAFTSLEGLAQTEFIADRSIRLSRLPDGRYEFRQSAPAQKLDANDMAGMDEAGIKALMAEMMKGFEAKMRVTVPGKIEETTADEHDEHSATWTYDLDKDTNALDRAQKMDIRIVFKGDGLNLKDVGSDGNL